MAIKYQVAQNGLRIETFPAGVLDTKATLDYFEKLQKDHSIKQGAIEIVYFKEVADFKISYLESVEITNSYQKPKNIQLISATVFVCETDLAYGIGRMLQTMHEIANPAHRVVVVRSGNDLEEVVAKLSRP